MNYSIEKNICREKVFQNFFLIYIVLLIVQDLILQLMAGTIARSPYIFLSPAIFLFITVLTSKVYSYKSVNYYLIYYLYSILITFVVLIYLVGFKGYGLSVYGENIIVKAVKNSIYNLIIIITLYNYNFIFRFSHLDFVEKALKVLVLSQLAVGFIQMIVPHAFDFLKTPGPYEIYRISLLNTEPSAAFPQLLLTLLSYLVIRSYRNKIKITDYLILLAGFILLLFIQSKGGIVIMVFCFMVILFFTKQSLLRRLILLAISIIFIVPTIWIIIQVIVPELLRDIEAFSSVSTRTITIMASLRSLLDYPWGQGYGTYLITFSTLLNKMVNYAVSYSPIPISTYELDNMITTGRALTVKSGLLNEVLYSGWFIIFFYIFFFFQAYKKLARLRNRKLVHTLFQFIFLFIIVNYLFVTTIETSYVAFLPISLLEKLYRDNSEQVSLELKAA